MMNCRDGIIQLFVVLSKTHGHLSHLQPVQLAADVDRMHDVNVWS